jgi:hypothetical protein
MGYRGSGRQIMIKAFLYSLDDGSFFKRALSAALLAFAGLFALAFIAGALGMLMSGGSNVVVAVAAALAVVPVVGITLVRAGSISDVENDRGSPAIPVVAVLFKWAAETSAVTIATLGIASVLAIGLSASGGLFSDYVPMASELGGAEGLEAVLWGVAGVVGVLVYAFVTLLSGHVAAEAFGALIRIADNSE